MNDTCDAFLNFLFYLGIAVDCLQGALVSMIFCFMNAEVSDIRVRYSAQVMRGGINICMNKTPRRITRRDMM